MQWLEQPAIKWAIPIPLFLAVAPVIWWFFRSTWRKLDADALVYRQALAERGEIDYRPMVALTLVAFILTFQDAFGRPNFYGQVIHGWFERLEQAHPGGLIDLERYDTLYAQSWWALTRIGGYVVPLAVWRLFFRRDALADFGLRTRGFAAHAWIYATCVVVMVPIVFLVSRQPDFAEYYPMYKPAGRSWVDFGVWESLYLLQFFTLEIFFRGFWLRAMRGFGSGAIWSMVVPYCMVHYGKPYLECDAAVIAGVVLGSLSMRTNSIYAGFLVHGTIGLLNDVLALDRRGELPSAITPGSPHHLVFPYWHATIWVAWVLALSVVVLKARREWPQLVARFREQPAPPAAGPGSVA
jgi:membrane protease YdiL (CAAX protease family)